MQRNWYIICTKEKREKKVTAALAKKGIESYCPFTKKEIKNENITRTEYAPVFNSYIFAFISVIEIDAIKRIPNIISLAHWQSKPVVLDNEEIDAIKMVSENYTDIQIEKIALNMEQNISYTTGKYTDTISSKLPVQPVTLQVALPAMGYTMIGKQAF
jgi:transcription antitermination factor NusG